MAHSRAKTVHPADTYDRNVGGTLYDNRRESNLNCEESKKESIFDISGKWAKLPKLSKNFYREDSEVARLAPEKVRRMRAENNNTTVIRFFEQKNAGIPSPVWKFEHCFKFYPDLVEKLYKHKFVKPSPIQAQAWPILLKGEDLICIAPNDTARTLAFLLPAMIHTEYQTHLNKNIGGTNVLILAPTRKSARQIEKEAKEYSLRGIRAVWAYGSQYEPKKKESIGEIIICTPDSLSNISRLKGIDLAKVTFLILDDADQMLDMGFEPQIRQILLDIRPDRQIVMTVTSAKLAPRVHRLAQSYMHEPIQLCVGSVDLADVQDVRQTVEGDKQKKQMKNLAPVLETVLDARTKSPARSFLQEHFKSTEIASMRTVRQEFEFVDTSDKIDFLEEYIRIMSDDDKTIIFCGTKELAMNLFDKLHYYRFMCDCIHSDQADNEQIINDFSTGKLQILIAACAQSIPTELVAATHVINFRFPITKIEYVQRINCVRCNGKSITFISQASKRLADMIINMLKDFDHEIPKDLLKISLRSTAIKERRAFKTDDKSVGYTKGRYGGCKR